MYAGRHKNTIRIHDESALQFAKRTEKSVFQKGKG